MYRYIYMCVYIYRYIYSDKEKTYTMCLDDTT